MTETYRGWPNRETWALRQHIGDTWNKRAADVTRDAVTSRPTWNSPRQEGAHRLALELKDWTEETFAGVIYGGDGSLAACRLVDEVGSRWRVDFYKLAEALVDEAVSAAP